MIFDDLWRTQRRRKKLGRVLDELRRELDLKELEEKEHWPPEESWTQADAEKRQDKFGDEIAKVELCTYYFRVAEDQIEAIETRQVKERVEKLGIPIGDASWQPGFEFNSTRLRPEARIAIAEQIRKERRARIEDRMLWVNYLGPLLSPLTGLVGTIIGLVALLHSCKSK
jgi:biopolymer transport protein ExbB/TolQ